MQNYVNMRCSVYSITCAALPPRLVHVGDERPVVSLGAAPNPKGDPYVVESRNKNKRAEDKKRDKAVVVVRIADLPSVQKTRNGQEDRAEPKEEERQHHRLPRHLRHA